MERQEEYQPNLFRLARIIYERFCCNRQPSGERQGARRNVCSLALCHSSGFYAISQCTVMNNPKMAVAVVENERSQCICQPFNTIAEFTGLVNSGAVEKPFGSVPCV